MLTTEYKNIHISEDTIIYLLSSFRNFDKTKLLVQYAENKGFDTKLAYSFDNQNWSNPLLIQDFELPLNNIGLDDGSGSIKLYISIWFVVNLFSESTLSPNGVVSLYNQKNIALDIIPEIIITHISYDSIYYTDNDILIQSFQSIVNQTPTWNIYDNQIIGIKRWIDTCSSLSYSHGHLCIYFKTEPDKNETVNTFANHKIRDVVSIRKLMIMLPNNDLPSERLVYTDWDMPLQDDFIINIVDNLFKIAFGQTTAPNSKDYLYIPFLNRLFRVANVQPNDKRYMGRIGWWECFLSKYEEDETIKLDSNQFETLMDFAESPDDFNGVFNVIEELEKFKEENIIDNQKIQIDTIEEKKLATQNFTNKLNDSTQYIDLKETENQRHFYQKRLTIVSVNPDTSAFPITMYDCTQLDNRVVGLTYNLIDAVSINKYSLLVNNQLNLDFNYVLLNKFAGEIIETNFFTITSKRNKQITIINHYTQETFNPTFIFSEQEFYNIDINYKKDFRQLSIKIYLLVDKLKKVVFQDLYILKIDNNISNNMYNLIINELIIYGGKYYINDISLKIDDNQIIKDNANPILNMRKF